MKHPISIWEDINKTTGLTLDLRFEGSRVVGIHNSGFTDVLSDIDALMAGLKWYREQMRRYYEDDMIAEFLPLLSSKRLTHIYIFKDDVRGFYKIGRSIKPKFREKTLQAEIPSISTIFISPLTDKKTEKDLHKKFAHKRLRGEWFSLTQDDIEIIKNYGHGLGLSECTFSISLMIASVNSSSMLSQFSFNCSTEVAPTIDELTNGCRFTNARAMAVGLSPCLFAMSTYCLTESVALFVV